MSHGATQRVGELRERSAQRLIRDVAREHGLEFASCLDIGCGRAKWQQWFEGFAHARKPHTYIGLETDAEMVAEARARGVDVRDPTGDAGECASDLTLCIEVIEHVLPEESAAFFRFAAANTRKALLLTTPNFEYFDGRRQKPEYAECRWIPDHLPFFNPAGGPHSHKQAMTPDNLTGYLADAFDGDMWDFRVYRAWPWRLHDLTIDATFELYFKLFAIAWRRA
jgi:2-polyprenyl-3-methyl-5-hydroxy-6-metoxy-1,4-benzoquinol methylase